MKKTTLILTIISVLTVFSTAHAGQIKCTGKKHFHSPYPGASSEARISLSINDESETVVLRIGGEVFTDQKHFALIDLQQDEAKGQFIFKGKNEDGKKISGKIKYFSKKGVTATVKTNKSLTYNCSVFSVQ